MELKFLLAGKHRTLKLVSRFYLSSLQFEIRFHSVRPPEQNASHHFVLNKFLKDFPFLTGPAEVQKIIGLLHETGFTLNMDRMVHLNKTFPWQKIFSKFQCPIILPIANLASTENFDPKAHPVQGKPWGQIDLPHWKPKVL